MNPNNSYALTVWSPKGGTGKTLVSINLALLLVREWRQEVALIDLNQTLGNDPFLLLDKPIARSISDLVPFLETLDSNMLKGYLISPESGLGLLSYASDYKGARAVTPQHLEEVIGLLKEIYKNIIIDTNGPLNDLTLSAWESSDLILLLFTPDLLTVRELKHWIEKLKSLYIAPQKIRYVLNRVGLKGGLTPAEIELALGIPLFATIGNDGEVLSFNKEKGSLLSEGRGPFTKGIRDLVTRIIEEEEKREDRKTKEKEERKEDYKKELLDLKMRVHSQLIEELDLKAIDWQHNDPKDIDKMKEKAERAIISILDSEEDSPLSRIKREELVKEILDEALGLGPLEDLLKDPTITEIMVNGPEQIYVERAGRIEPADKKFISAKQLLNVIQRIVAPIGRRIDESVPLVDARLPDGSRVNAIIPPLSLIGPCLTIRKFSRDCLTIEDLLRSGSLTKEVAEFLRAVVLARKNIIISGGTGSGKTTLLNVISSFIPVGERIITIEDSAELRLPQEHVVTLESRPPNIEGKGEITIRDLVRNALRMRPNRLVVGECRSGEALDMLQAMNTGHDGSLTTAHANSPRHLLSRLETMVLMAGIDLPVRAIREQIVGAIDFIIHLARLKDGSRKVIQVTEVLGLEGETIVLQDIFLFKQKGLDDKGNVLGELKPTGFIPRFFEDLEAQGIKLERKIFS